MAKGNIVPKGGEIVIYQSEGGQTKIEVRLEGETLWLNQAGLAKLYQTTIPNINIHIKNIYDEGELLEEATIKDYLIVQTEGGRQVSRQVKHYNLDMIISVGYRIKSHWAITGMTAAEIVHKRVDSTKPNMGLTSRRGEKVRKGDVVIAKNYLKENELRALNNLVEQYLVFAEGQAMRRIPMHMKDWINKLDGFLSLNDRDILTNAGRISHEMAKQLAEEEYEKFNRKRIECRDKQDSDFDRTVKMIEEQKKKLPPDKK